MKIKGEYRDILSRNGEVIVDTGWQSNVIVADYGRFLAALMKKDFNRPQVGIDYMAVGSGSGNDKDFKNEVEKFFDLKTPGGLPKPTPSNNWVWTKEIDVSDIKYLNPWDEEVTDVTNRLRIEVTFGKGEPSEDTFEFKEFALLGIDKENGGFVKGKLFFINYVDHGVITKDKNMELTRTIILTFPIGKEGVS